MPVNVEGIEHDPVVPTLYRLFGRTVIVVGRVDPFIKRIDNDFFLIMLERRKDIRKYTVELSTARIITPVPGYSDPFRIPACLTQYAPAVIPEDKTSAFTHGTKVLTTVRQKYIVQTFYTLLQ